MLKKLVTLVFTAAVIVGLASCDVFRGDTGVKGKLILEPGQTGDVRNARVELYQKSDLTGNPLKVGQSKSDGLDASEAEFEIKDVLSGYYYLRAWKDMDNDGKLSGGDLVGVYGGTYTPGKGGTQLTIEDGKMANAGNISMKIFVEPLAVTASGSLGDAGRSVTYTYTFNLDVTLSTFSITMPGINTYTDSDEQGSRTGGKSYTTQKYVVNGGVANIPKGTHTLRLQGTCNGKAFDKTVQVTI